MLWSKHLWAASALPLLALANKDSLNQDYSQLCYGMYTKSTWGGSINPFISTNLLQTSDSDDSIDISVVVFDYQDIDVLGKVMSDGNKKYVCDHTAVNLELCDEDDLGKFIVNEESLGQNKSEIYTYSINSKGLQDPLYHVKNTGYYCVATYESSLTATYKVQVNFQNSFGQIAASEYPKLPLYAALALAYAISFAYYGFNFWKHKHEILPLQKYFLFFFTFLTLETVLVWSLYDLTNVKGASNAGVKVYVVFISILNGFKFSFSFFLLLIISLGYGVVHPKLDKKLMLKAQIFSVVHWVSAVFYIIANYLTTVESSLAGFSALPVMILTVIFYVVTLKALSQTTALLNTQKQVIKLNMYRRLFRIIFVSLLVLILGVFISAFIYIGMSTTELIEQHWKTRFFFLEFWPSLIYFFIFNLIAFIWRPTDTSYMLAASSQLPTDPENAADFELDDIQSLQPNDDDDADGYQNLRNDNDSLNLGSEDELDDAEEERERERENARREQEEVSKSKKK